MTKQLKSAQHKHYIQYLKKLTGYNNKKRWYKMTHIFKTNKNKFFCYLIGTIIGAFISFILATLLATLITNKTYFTGSAFYDVQFGSLAAITLYTLATGDMQKHFKTYNNNFSVILFTCVILAGIAPVINWILLFPILFIYSNLQDLKVFTNTQHLYFIYGGSNMLGFWFLYKNEPGKYD